MSLMDFAMSVADEYLHEARLGDLRTRKMKKEKKRKIVVWRNVIREHSCFATIAINIFAKHILQTSMALN